jgi:transposase
MIRVREYRPPLYYATDEIAAAIPQNFYARLEAVLAGQWERLAEPLRKAFVKGWGRPTDPVVYLKCYLIGYFENLSYDTDLAERVADSISVRAFLGYTLVERTPDHSSLSRVRAAVGERCDIGEVLERVVGACAEAGLVGGEVAALDGSLVPANAALSSLRSLQTGKSVREHMREVRERNRALGEGEKKETLTVSNGEFVSETDKDAKIACKRKQRRALYYRANHVTDGQAQIILAAEAGGADVGEAEAAKSVLTQAEETLRENARSLSVVVADAGYDAAELHAHIEQLGGTPLTFIQKEVSPKPAGVRKSDFLYLAEEDCYQCPGGKRLGYVGQSKQQHVYRSQRDDCAECPLRQGCLGNSKGQVRTIERSPYEASRARNQARGASEEGRALLKQRGQIVEAPFGHMKTYGGLRLINCRGRQAANVKVVLAAVAWNVIKLVGVFFPQKAPTGAPRPAGADPQAGAAPEGAPHASRLAAGGSRGPRHPSVWARARALLPGWLRPGPVAWPRLHPLLR